MAASLKVHVIIEDAVSPDETAISAFKAAIVSQSFAFKSPFGTWIEIVDMISLLTLTAFVQFFPATAQQSWRDPNITVSRADRVNIAEAAIAEAITFLDNTTGLFTDPAYSYGVSGAFYSQLAEFDLATNQTKYANDVQQYLFLAANNLEQYGAVNFTGEYVSFDFNSHSSIAHLDTMVQQLSDGLNFGHGAAMEFATYKDPIFLEYAKQVWWIVESYTLSQSEVDAGTVPSKNFAMTPTCQGITMAGGTFREKAFTAPAINTLSTGGFLVLSALLAEATGDDVYLDAAQNSASFIRNHLLNSDYVVQDGISVRVNDSCALDPETDKASYNSGLMIEGLAILYSVTSNASIFDLIEEILPAVIQYSGWQGSNGIIGNGATKSGDIMLPRALATVKARNATTPALQSYIQSYLNVQFNAVVELATANGSNIYSGSWSGPPSSSFSCSNQTNAIQVLIGAINLDNSTAQTTTSNGFGANASSPASSPSSSSRPSPPTPREAAKIGPIIGGILGGLVILLATVVVVLYRRRSETTSLGGSYMSLTRQINPFDLHPSHAPAMPGSQFPRVVMPSRVAKRNVSALRIPQGSTDSSSPAFLTGKTGAQHHRAPNNTLRDEDEPPEYSSSAGQ
ncbi:hypothetical protein C8R45DRAFT_1183631 [Mycena sanguinolenta]|nr:hypothetical protein C8R45DRAFT_1183631 [Mycena sanguinolenta]